MNMLLHAKVCMPNSKLHVVATYSMPFPQATSKRSRRKRHTQSAYIDFVNESDDKQVGKPIIRSTSLDSSISSHPQNVTSAIDSVYNNEINVNRRYSTTGMTDITEMPDIRNDCTKNEVSRTNRQFVSDRKLLGIMIIIGRYDYHNLLIT